jgi:hypothetical protein
MVLLDELLRRTLPVRDLYKAARNRSADIHYCQLRPLFDSHHRQQLRLVDVLVDQIRASGGSNRVLLGGFLRRAQPRYDLWARIAPNRLLCELLDAHELVLGAAQPTVASNVQTDKSGDAGCAVGRVVLTNDLQMYSVRKRLVGLSRTITSR